MKGKNRKEVTRKDMLLLAIKCWDIQKLKLGTPGRSDALAALADDYGYRSANTMLATLGKYATTRKQSIAAFREEALRRRVELTGEEEAENFVSTPSGITKGMLINNKWTTKGLAA
jgi:hypothetical protein